MLYKEHAAKAGINISIEQVPTDGYWSEIWNVKPFCVSVWYGQPTEDMMFTQAFSAESAWNDEYVEVQVTDNGCGIPKSQIPKLFEPFTSTKGQKGTGLGLAVTWGIVDNHNGTISVASEVGEGTTFTIRIPVGA